MENIRPRRNPREMAIALESSRPLVYTPRSVGQVRLDDDPVRELRDAGATVVLIEEEPFLAVGR